MSGVELIDCAVEAIGRGRPDDRVLTRTGHADELADNASALAHLLRTAAMETLARQHERLDQEAGVAQQKFKRAMSYANWAMLVTAALGACIMVVSILTGVLGERAMRPLLVLFGVSAMFSGAVASMCLFRVREGNLLETWMGCRAHAEGARLSYFSTLVQTTQTRPTELPLGLLKLEYFRRFQLDVQLTYYAGRADRHRNSADQTLMLGGLAVAAAAVASGSAGIVASIDAPWAALAAVGVIGTALAAFAATREAVNQDRRNAERYGRTLASLEILRAKLDDVRGGVLAGSQAVLEEYVAAVHEQLSLEHREWLSGAESTRSAIVKLDETLAALQKDTPS